MSIPSNFIFFEQQPLAVTNAGEQVQFVKTPVPAGQGGDDCFVYNGGAKGCQVLTGSTQANASAAQDASAAGTKQFKCGAGVGILVKLNGDRWIGAITEGSDTTTLYCHRGSGQ